MSDIAQIYLLPPPVRLPTTGRALTSQSGRSTGGAIGGSSEDGGAQGGAAVNEQLRARRFRFRVHEGGETSGTGTELDTRRAGSNATRAAASNIDLGNPDSLQSQGGRNSRSSSRDGTFTAPSSGASSAFIAQSIAQEQLGEGLHNPPYAAASTAYTRTGASLTPRPSAGVDVTA